jgi:hypothetical protein
MENLYSAQLQKSGFSGKKYGKIQVRLRVGTPSGGSNPGTVNGLVL